MVPLTVTRDEIQRIVLTALTQANLTRNPDQQLDIAPCAPIFGPGSPLDSLGLVALVMDVEEALQDRGIAVTLSDELAMSQIHSPFRDVPALVSYIWTLVGDTP